MQNDKSAASVLGGAKIALRRLRQGEEQGVNQVLREIQTA